jgi:hypothetical protein
MVGGQGGDGGRVQAVSDVALAHSRSTSCYGGSARSSRRDAATVLALSASL